MRGFRVSSLVVGSLLILTVSIISLSAQERSKKGLEGVWSVVERDTADGKKDTSPPPSVRIFTARHFSWNTAGINRPEVPFEKATDAQKAALWQFGAQTGTYEVTGTEIVTHASIAKDPAIAKPSYSATYEVKVDSDVLMIRRTKPTVGAWTKYRRLE